MASSIIDEYTSLLRKKASIETALTSLPQGYISRKNIKGNTYSYLQVRVHGQVKSAYLKAGEAEKTENDLSLRRKYESELPAVENRLEEIEKAAEFLGADLVRRLEVLKLSIGMDELPGGMKQLCVSFSEAMTSIEGIPASDETKKDLQSWMSGAVSFLSVFESTLKRYGFTVEANE